MSPTAHTLAYLRRAGFLVEPVERWIIGANVKRDLYGIGDVLAVHPVRREFLMVQATSVGHVSDRLTRVRRRLELRTWLQAGGLFECWGWFIGGGRWQVRRVPVTLQDLGDVCITALPRRRRRDRQRMLFETAEAV